MNPLLQQLIVPDLWQRDAVQHLRAGRDVVVHAPTGAGKTFIFEMIQRELRGQAVFTVPTRALANDKLAMWRAEGWRVGIATGDLAIDLEAPVVVATLETQRGRLLRGEGPRLLVVDEYQLLADEHRGVNYELVLALAPPQTQLLLLSGSVGNPGDVVAWLQRLGRDAVLVSHVERPVPLVEVDLENLPNRAPATIRGLWPRWIANALRAELGPVLLFAPRRAAAEELAQTLACQLPCPEPLALTVEQEGLLGPRLAKLLRARVAYHHSGLSYAQRAGVIEPLARAGQLRVVVATMGLAAGIHFSMRSVAVTDMRYTVGRFERTVQPDELLQMFGRAGRRGLDETGHVLFSSRPPRLLDARPRRLQRATQLDWPTLLAVMQAAVVRGEAPFAAASALNARLFTPQTLPLGFEHSLATGPRACGSMVDMERARIFRRTVVEMQNYRGVWEPLSAGQQVALGHVLARDEKGRWRRADTLPGTLGKIGYGQLCKLRGPDGGIPPGPRRYGREVCIGVRRPGGIEIAPWLREEVPLRLLSVDGLAEMVLRPLCSLIATAARREKRDAGKFTIAAIFPRGEALVAHCDFSAQPFTAHRDAHGCWLMEPPTRESRSALCEGCDERAWCGSVPITADAAWAWRRLGLIGPDGAPTGRGRIFSQFHHGEGLAIAAAIEDATYPVEDLVFDLANLRAGPRFAGEDAPHSGRLAALCQQVYDRADFPGYLEMGVPPGYGAGAAEVVREHIEAGTAKSRHVTETLRLGDIERGLVEWRSLLREVALAAGDGSVRWQQFCAACQQRLERLGRSTEIPQLPPLAPHQMRR